ncbi:MAG: hypothetical protein LQ338_008233 [Usnochroma carphineum]|nr:MAG: hypothetical protein LQ338_008233 [Usnochroma carphineum]
MSTQFSTYRDAINRSLHEWPELTWLNRFLQAPSPADGHGTSAQIFELIGTRFRNRFAAFESDGTAAAFSQALEVETKDSRLRIVLIGHGESWDVDRDIIDVVCSKYNVDPRFLAKHFDYPDIRWEKNCPPDIRLAVENVNRDYIENKYTWDLGGDVMSPLSMQLDSCFFFAYDTQSLSLAIHREDDKVTLLLLLRAPRSQLVDMSRPFFNYPNARPMGSTLLDVRRPKSLYEVASRALLDLEFPEIQNSDWLIGRAILPYVTNLVNCCNANYHRNISPRALKPPDVLRADQMTIFNEIRQLATLERELESFLDRLEQGLSESKTRLSLGRETLRLLDQLTKDYNEVLSYYQAGDRSSESDYLGALIQAQVDEAKEAKKISKSLGQLSQLAYIFLPLQLTASAMGMNLKNFGTGNIELKTFVLMLATIATVSFAPIFFPSLYWSLGDRWSQVRDVTKYSRRAGLLFGLFCLFHRQETNDKLWRSGIEWDIEFFHGRQSLSRNGTDDSYWVNRRADVSTALRKPPFVLIPRFWQAVVEELWDIIDKPQWGRNDTSHHTA